MLIETTVALGLEQFLNSSLIAQNKPTYILQATLSYIGFNLKIMYKLNNYKICHKVHIGISNLYFPMFLNRK